MSEPVSLAKAAAKIHVESVQLTLLAPDPDQVRKHFDETALQSLADSIKANGLIQPIVVRPRAPGEPAHAGVREHDYRIVAGERRYRAAKLAGITEIPVIVRDDLAAGDITVLQVLENLQRQDLSLAETCTGVSRLVDTIGFAKTCKQLGKSEPWVSKHAGLHKLPEAVVELVRLGKIESVDIARELAAVKELDEEHFERLVQRFKPQDAKAPEPDELPDPATEAEAELLVDQVSETQMWSNRPPTRADIRAALASLRLEREEEKASAKVRAGNGVNGTSHDDDADDLDEEEGQDESEGHTETKPKAAGESAAERERRARREYAEKLQAENAAFAEQRRVQLQGLLGGAPLKDEGEHSDGVSLDEKYLHAWGNEPLPADPMGSTFVVLATGPVQRVAPALRALGITTEISIDPEDLTLDEAEAIAKLLGRPLRIVRIEHLSGGALFEALNAEAARQAASTPKGKGKAAKPAKTEAADPHGIAAFLAACVKKSRIPGRRIQPSVLHQAYEKWCKAQQREAIPIKHNGWGQGIEDAGIEKLRSNGFWYVGIELVGGGKS